MSARRPVRWALALLERCLPRPYGSALAGDLMEGWTSGQTAGWVWGQVLHAVAMRAWNGVRAVLPLVAYSAAWSLLYPFWQGAWDRAQTERAFARWSALDWPYSSLLQLGGGLVLPVTFVWGGVLVYLMLSRAQGDRAVSPMRVVGSLSLSVSVLLTATISLMSWAGRASAAGQVIFFLVPYRPEESVPLALSVLAAVATVRPRTRLLRVS